MSIYSFADEYLIIEYEYLLIYFGELLLEMSHNCLDGLRTGLQVGEIVEEDIHGQ